MKADSWACPVCGHNGYSFRFRKQKTIGMDAKTVRPSADRFGYATGLIVECRNCGHGSVKDPPDTAALADSYQESIDEVSLREEAGQIATAHRDLERIEKIVPPGRLLDVGCWTGSFLIAAKERGWDGLGVEPSEWASDRARHRGVEVVTGRFEDLELEDPQFRLVVLSDVIEHVTHPGPTLEHVAGILEKGGLLFITTPNAGSPVARLLGSRWWSILPMHLQYFTRASIKSLLEARGFFVRSITTHPKVFTGLYYAERMGGYSAGLGSIIVRICERAGLGNRLIAPNFGDRMAVMATLR